MKLHDQSGRSSGVGLWLLQVPWISGSPQGVWCWALERGVLKSTTSKKKLNRCMSSSLRCAVNTQGETRANKKRRRGLAECALW